MATEANFSVNLYHRYAAIVTLSQFGIVINIDLLGQLPVLRECIFCDLTQMAAFPRVQHDPRPCGCMHAPRYKITKKFHGVPLIT